MKDARTAGDCSFHPINDEWLYVRAAGAKLCLQCLNEGLFNEEWTNEAIGCYPEKVNPAKPLAFKIVDLRSKA